MIKANEQKGKVKLFSAEILLWIITAIIMIPIYYLVVTTIKTPADALNHPLGFPKTFNINGYINAWNTMNYPHVFMNTFVITASSLVGMIVFSSMAAYTIARRTNKLNSIIFMVFLAGMMVPFQMSILSQYKLISSLGLMNKLPSVILVNIAAGTPVSVLFIRNFIISSVPIQLEEAAFIDGASVFRTFFQITLPLIKPVIATIAVMNSMGIWNDFLTPLMFLQSTRSQTIILAVNSNIGKFSTNWIDLFPMMLLGVAPLILFYIFTQKYIIKGITTGAVKG